MDVNKLIVQVKKYKEPKTKGRANQKKKAGSNKKATASSSTLSKSFDTTPKGSHGLDKCTNCNRYYITTSPTTSTSSRTNVAVTINRQTSSTSRAKHPVSYANCSTQVSFTAEHTENTTPEHARVSSSSLVQNDVQQNFLPASSVAHVTSNQGILTTGLIGHNHSGQMYPSHDLLHGGICSVASHNSNNTSSNGCHGYTNNPVTSEAKSGMLDNDLVVLDYDGMNLVQSDQTDFAKALMNESDISLFENDLLNYLPDYLPDFQPSLQNGAGVMSPMTTAPSQVVKATPYGNFREGTLCNQVMSSQIGLPGHPHHGNLDQQSNAVSGDMVPRIGRTLCSPTDMISTDCHTFNSLTPSLLHSRANIDGLLPDGHQCPSKDLTLRGHANVFEMGVPGVNVAEMGVSQNSFPEVGVSQTMSQFGRTQVSGVGSCNLGGAHESTFSPQGVPMGEMLNGTNEAISNGGVDRRNISEAGLSQFGMSRVGMSQFGRSENPVSSVETIEDALPNVCVSNMDLRVAGTTHDTGTQLSVSQAGMSQFHVSSAGISQLGVSHVQTTLPNVGASSTHMSTNGTSSSRTSAQSNSEATGHLPENIITEFSPEWSYCDGKTKILILGDWSRSNGQYSCLFDGCSVPATLIQSGVLRCYCPPHEPGLVSLQVAWNGFIISNACVFEYKTRENATNSISDWFGTGEEDLKKLILERIERLESMLGIDVSSGITAGEAGTAEGKVGTIEDRIVRICEVLFRQPGACQLIDAEPGPKGLTLLHLAAGLGYTKLIRFLQNYTSTEKPCSMRTGREGSNSMTGTAEVSKEPAKWFPHAKDSFGCTPLMWACWRGHRDAVMTLLAWQPSTYSDCDQSGRSAKAIAQEMGHVALVHQMEDFMCEQDM